MILIIISLGLFYFVIYSWMKYQDCRDEAEGRSFWIKDSPTHWGKDKESSNRFDEFSKKHSFFD